MQVDVSNFSLPFDEEMASQTKWEDTVYPNLHVSYNPRSFHLYNDICGYLRPLLSSYFHGRLSMFGTGLVLWVLNTGGTCGNSGCSSPIDSAALQIAGLRKCWNAHR